jgi:hypothetical protein
MYEGQHHLPTEPTLTELTGREVDAQGFYLSLAPSLANRGISLEDYARQQLVLRPDLIAKIIRYGDRTPVAPHLREISERLGRALYLGEDCTADELSELLAQFKAEIDEAEAYYDG